MNFTRISIKLFSTSFAFSSFVLVFLLSVTLSLSISLSLSFVSLIFLFVGSLFSCSFSLFTLPSCQPPSQTPPLYPSYPPSLHPALLFSQSLSFSQFSFPLSHIFIQYSRGIYFMWTNSDFAIETSQSTMNTAALSKEKNTETFFSSLFFSFSAVPLF